MTRVSARRGRPRTFDLDRALESALRLFWEKGYEGTSISDLTEAIGINRPSLYAAFGDKEALFRQVVERYICGPGSHAVRALEEPTAREAAERILLGSVELLADPEHPKGCLLVQGALSCGEESGKIRQELAAARAAGELALCRRFERGKEEGELPPDADPADLARYIAAVNYGLAVLAAGGTGRDDLRRVVETAMRAWPSSDTA